MYTLIIWLLYQGIIWGTGTGGAASGTLEAGSAGAASLKTPQWATV